MATTESDRSSLTADKFEEIDREVKYKTVIADEKEATALLAFYRDRIVMFDEERNEWLQKLDQLLASKDEYHDHASILQAKREELADLQRSISEARISQYHEKEQVLKLKRENDQLKLKELENRKRIYELLMINEPAEKENTFYRDLRPDVKKTMKNDLSIHLNKRQTDNTEKGFTGSQRFGTTSGRDVLKTIYLPNEQINTITVENENLKRRIKEEETVYTEQIQVLHEELERRTEELRRRQDADEDKLRELADKNKVLSGHKSLLAKQYFSMRLQVNDRKQKLHVERQILKLKADGLNQTMQTHERLVETEHKIAQEMIEKKAEEYTNKFRGRIKQKDESLVVIRDQYAHVQKTYIEKLKAIEDNLTKLATKYQTLEQRRMLEYEDFRGECKSIEKRVKQFELKYFNSTGLEKDRNKISLTRSKGYEVVEDELEPDDDYDDDTASIPSQEFSIIKQQLAELENKLDKVRGKKEWVS